jgi:diguanylate cyclase (GGDEF)-like protein
MRSVVDRAQFFFQDKQIFVTISLGVTEVTPADDSAESVFARADGALYESKRNGRNRVSMA